MSSDFRGCLYNTLFGTNKTFAIFYYFLSKEKERKKTDTTNFVEKDNKKRENKIKKKGA